MKENGFINIFTLDQIRNLCMIDNEKEVDLSFEQKVVK